MKYTFFLLLIVNCMCFSQTEDTLCFPGERHLRNIRMLTGEGENAEAYLSFSGTQLIYQSTSGGLECDQIFTMNLDGTGKKMVSTGKGRTTCSYFLPGDTTFIYASTHEAAASCPPLPDKSKGYVWKLYETFDIYRSDRSGNHITKLTDTPGYDAEATVSPVGDKIVFTSLRDGDPELYMMNIDGSSQTRLTFEKGYDGGAFFSADGTKLVFRASRPKSPQELADYDDLVKNGYVRPTALEIFVLDLKTGVMTQVTHFGKASFAPFFHPDMKRIIFSSNINSNSGRNFDLYIINTDGTGFEQITFFDAFDGFPMFTADGSKIVFGSNRHANRKGDTNIFIADWID